MTRRVLQRAAIAALLATAFLAVLLTALAHSRWARDYATSRIRDEGRAAGVIVDIGTVSYNLARGTADVTGVTLSRPGSAIPFLKAGRVQADVDVWRLATGGGFTLESGAVEGLAIHIVREAGGATNLPESSGGSGSDELPDFHIANLNASGSLLVEDRAASFEGSLPQWNLRVSGKEVSFTAPGGAVVHQRRSLTLGAISLNGGFDRREAWVRDLRIGLPEGALTASGKAVGFNRPVVDLSASLQVGLPAVLTLSGFPDIAREVRGGVRVDTRWPGAIEQARTEAVVRLERANLQALSSRFQAAARIASTAGGVARAEWRGLEWMRATGEATLNLVPSGAAAEGVLPVSGTVRARGGLRGLRIDARDLRTLGTDTQASLEWNGSGLGGTVESRSPEIARMLPEIAAFLGKQDLPEAAGTLTATAQLGGTLERPEVEAKIEGREIRYGPIAEARIDIEAAYSPSLVDVKQARAAWKGAEVSAAGGIALPLRTLSFEARTNGVGIAEVLGALGRAEPVTGTLTAAATASGTIDEPRVDAEVRGADLAAYGEALGELSARASLAGGTLTVESLELRKPDGVLNATGTLARDAYTLQASASDFAIRSLALPGGQAVRGVIGMSASGAGTFADPQLKLEGALRDVEAAGHKLGTIAVKAEASGGSADFTADAREFEASIAGRVATAAPYASTIRASLRGTDLTKIPGAPAGSVTAEVEAAGELANWRAARVEVKSGRLTAAGSAVSFEGMLPGALRYSGSYDLAALETGQSGLTLAGAVAVEGSLTGSFERLEPAARVTLRNGVMRNPSLRVPVEAQADLALENGTIRVNSLSAQAGAGRLTATGSVPLGLFPIPAPIVAARDSGPAKFSLEASDLRIESLFDVPESVRGALALKGEMTASRPELHAVEAVVTIPELSLDLAGIRLTPDAPPRLTLRNGVAAIEHFTLQGNTATLRAAGSLDLATKQLRGVLADGSFDAALLTSFSRTAAASGPVTLHAEAQGTLNDPKMTGYVEWADGQAALSGPALQASDLNVRIGLAGNEVRIERFAGELNGGPLSASGSFGIASGSIRDPRLEMAAENVYLDFPEGLQTRSTAKLSVAAQREAYVLQGTVRVEEGSYTRPLDLQTQLLQYVRNRGGVELVGDRNPHLARLRYNVAIQAREPIVMDNNLGELALTADLRLLGTYYRPGLTGRIEFDEGGTLRLNENKYTIESGTISFLNETRIEPSLDLSARTNVAGREIGMRIYSGRDGIETDLTSDNPDDTRADIMALLLTGRTAEKLEGRELSVVGEQAGMALLAGSFTGRVSEQLTNTLGLSSVRIEPSLISAEKNPTARLTVGQDIATGLEFIYSMDLTNSSDQIYIVDYELTRRFDTRATRQDDNSYRFDFQHDLRFGGPRAEKRQRPARRIVGDVRFTGELAFPPETLADRFGMDGGDRFDFFRVRRGLDSIGTLYRKNNYLEARVRLRPNQEGDRVDFQIHAEAGPAVAFAFEGWEPPGSLRDTVRDTWSRGVFDAQRISRSEEAIRGALARGGYLRPEIRTSVRIPELGAKNVTFEVAAGQRSRNVKPAFPGASGIDAKTIESRIEQARLKDAIAGDPDQVRDFVERLFRSEGYLDATVAGPEYEVDEAVHEGRVRFPVREGPRYRVGEVRFEGASAVEAAELEKTSRLRAGAFYTPKDVEDSRGLLEEVYWARGYRDVTLDYRLEKRQAAGEVDVTVTVEEHQKSVVEEVRVAGNRITSEDFVRRQIVLHPGDVLSFRRTARSRRNLYDSGAFSSVDLREEPGTADPEVKRVRLVADVQERTPFQVRYGAFFDTERGPGFIADFSNRNSLGGGRLIGVRTRYDSDVREARLYFSQPLLRQLPLKTDATLFRRRELRDAFITDRTGFTLQQLVRMRDRFELTYGYRIEQAHTFDRVPDEFLPFDETLRIAPLTSTLSRDTRDEVLDATRGSFNSQAIELSSATLGSDLRYIRYFGQYFRYFGLGRPAPVPFHGAVERPRVIFATGARLGLAHGFGGQEVIRSERFFAGGGTTVRGFAQDRLGPLDFLGQPDGGNAMLVLNNELRFPLLWYFEGVTFLDAGNVFPTVRDFRFGALRATGGAGLRVRTPYFLLRADYGAKFSPRPGESRGAWFFSIGQAF